MSAAKYNAVTAEVIEELKAIVGERFVLTDEDTLETCSHDEVAEKHYDAGELDKARAALRKAFDINPRMRGVSRICEKLGVPCPVPDAKPKEPAEAK